MTFEKLGLSTAVLKALSELGFEKPSEIQKQAIPLLADGENDFIGLAQTGTGKTAAFGLPLLERIDSQSKITQALILAPTRELGQQIAEQLELYSKYLNKVNILAVFGGVSITNQIDALRRPQHIIIATPGRLIDLVKRKAVKLDKIKYVILDEADEMLNMGFKAEIDKILSYTPSDKLTWLFSATMPEEIKRIVATYMDNPTEVRIDAKTKVNVNIEHQYVLVHQSNKVEALARFLDATPDMRGVVFCRTKKDTQELSEEILRRNYKADALHGDLSQQQRDRVMKRFKNHELQILVATDVAARGIDVSDLSHVFHYTLSDDISYYTHRSGRTARAGKNGISIAFVNGREKGMLDRVARQLNITFSKVLIPNTEDIADIRIQNWCAQILKKSTRAKTEKRLVDKVRTAFEDLTKEELIEKILAIEVEKLNIGSSKDLNEVHHYDRQQSRDRYSSGNRFRSGGGRRQTSYEREPRRRRNYNS